MLLITFAAWRWVRQPAHRRTAAWTVMLELVLLAVVCALPFWPRISLIGATSPEPKTVAELSAAGDLHEVARPPLPTASVYKRMMISETPSQPEVSEPATPPVPPQSPWTWINGIAVGYLAGAALAGLWLGWGAVAAMVVCRRARPAADPLRAKLSQVVRELGDCPDFHAVKMGLSPLRCRVPRLLVSPHVTTAVAVGVLRPTIVLPVGLAESSSPHALRAVLAHEYAHIRNRDLWLLTLGRCLLTVFFTHPLFWWLRRAIRSDQELLADAVAAGERRHDYAEELLRLMRKTARPSLTAVSAAVGIWEGSSQLSRRIAMLVDETFRIEPRGSRRWRYQALGLLMLLGAACSLVTLQPARSEEEEKKSVSAAGSKSDEKPQPTDESPAEGSKKKRPEKITKIDSSIYFIRSIGTISDNDISEDLIILPGYPLLMDRTVVKELNLTAEQKNKLYAIQAEFLAERQKFFQETKKMTREEAVKAYAPWRKKVKAVQEQVEAVLTPRQTQDLKELALAMEASQFLGDPKVHEKLGVTAEQESKLQKIFGERADWYKDSSKHKEKALAVLTPQQRAQLRVEALGPEGPDYFTEEGVKIEGEAELIFVPSSFPYPDLSRKSVRKKLELSAAQEKQVQKILGDSSSLTEKLVREVLKLSPEKAKKQNTYSANFTVCRSGTFTISSNCTASASNQILTPEERKKQEEKFLESMKKGREKQRAEREKQPQVKMCIALRKQFETVLTPKQLAKYKDMTLRHIFDSALHDPLLLHKIGASDEQKAALQRLFDENNEMFRQLGRESSKKLLKVLTPPQQEKLRDEIERRESDPPAGVQSPPKDAAEVTIEVKSGQIHISGDTSEVKSGQIQISGETSTVEMSSPDGERDRAAPAAPAKTIILPAYGMLRDAEIQKKLELRAEQKKKLCEITAAYQVKLQKLNRETLIFSPGERQAKLAEYQQKINPWVEEVRKQVEDVLTSRQIALYKKLAFPMMVQGMIHNPEVLKIVDITPEQKEKLQQLPKEMEQQLEQDWQKYLDQTLAVLNPQQREKLRPEVEQFYRKTHYELADPGTLPRTYHYVAVEFSSFEEPKSENNAQTDYLSLPVYENLNQPAVRKTLNLSADQQEQLQKIANEYQAELAKLGRETQKLTPEEQKEKQRDLTWKYTQISKEVRQKIEALLTPERLTALKDIEFRSAAPHALAYPRIQEKIGLSDRQKAALNLISLETGEKSEHIYRETQEKSLGLLTPPQQEKLREELDRRGW